jgi:hypothetical protein
MPEAPNAHKGRGPASNPEGINPRDTSSMPRGEDDDKTRANSPEFHDRSAFAKATADKTDVPEAGSNVPGEARR